MAAALANQAQLTLALKAKPIAWAAYYTGAYVNAKETATLVDIHFKDATSTIEQDQSSSAALYHLGDAKTNAKDIVFGLLDHFSMLAGDDAKFTKEWIEFAFTRLSGDFKTVSPALEEMDDHLRLRTYFTDHKITASDIALYGMLKINNAALGSVKKSTYVNLGRWFRNLDAQTFISSANQEVQNETAAATKKAKSAGAGKDKKTSNANFEIGLQDAKDGQVVTRFPPEPSGYLHIGHAKAAMLNQFFAEKYHGKLIIRFDDTNPSKEKAEFQDSILEDLKLLGIMGDQLSYTSDHFQTLFDYAVELIKQGDAYVDDTDQMTMRAERMDGIASARRNRTVEENLKLFTEEMRYASDIGKKNCLRAKMSVDDNNKALRDPVIYRVNELPHHRSGTAWKIYPTYDFCCPLVDSIEGVTHALRTIEYRDRNPQYEWFLQKLSLRKVHVWDFARMNFIRTLLSKRKLQWFVDQGFVEGWDDPRFPTVRGIRRRGMQVAALKEFILSQGPSKNVNNLDWTSIWAINKKEIDPVAPRHVAIADGTPVSITGRTGDAASSDLPKHKKNPDLGYKKTWFSNNIVIEQEDAATLEEGEEITLMDWGNAFVTTLKKGTDGKVLEIEMKLHLEGDFKKTSKKLTWLSTEPETAEVELREFDHLITKDKLEEGDSVENFLTEKTEFKTVAQADLNVRELQKGAVIQFERKGYFIVDQAYEAGGKVVFFAVPDGKVINRYGAKTA
ncbi:protein of unknown function [Taphrina deformans PYCC 5710]|uniref:glutamate--tRNA ligase n=1 Tax=Taphrina deformans (strain PYCC 5710 / ATCC 11124 / CBS 356.35 / IMI 108563 / JCM 9778 / NBRC 8474) TaxID=1097556 RepID=R4XG37_TAPDE|nr:protein of unknown function [Taphrina deformans PYCC 5710]|eukprot:CCG84690.1 protein of unknown function [Taphrina deformans PYCC 5710]